MVKVSPECFAIEMGPMKSVPSRAHLIADEEVLGRVSLGHCCAIQLLVDLEPQTAPRKSVPDAVMPSYGAASLCVRSSI